MDRVHGMINSDSSREHPRPNGAGWEQTAG